MEVTFVPKVVMMNTMELTGASFNPPDRTEEGAKLKKLVNAIGELGGIVEPLIISKDHTVIDGNRRLAAAKILRIKEVPVIESPLGLQRSWVVLNSATLNISSRDYVQAYGLGMDIANMPKTTRRQLNQIEKLIGQDGINDLVRRGMASTVIHEARSCARYIEGKKGTRQPIEDKMVEMVLRWMIDKGQQTPARRAIARKMTPALLEYAVRHNLELEDTP